VQPGVEPANQPDGDQTARGGHDKPIGRVAHIRRPLRAIGTHEVACLMPL